jgi:hypothetical protein
MPRRTKPYIETYKTLVNGGRAEVEKFEGDEYYDRVLDPIDTTDVAERVAAHVDQFAQLAHSPSREQLINDLSFECGSARTLRLDVLLVGSRTKPDEWAAQILVRQVRSVLKKHKIKASISEYERNGQLVQSLYLRIIPGLIKIAGFSPPADIKSLALRARR